MNNAPRLMVFSGLAIVLSVLSRQFLGDKLRDRINPRLSKERQDKHAPSPGFRVENLTTSFRPAEGWKPVIRDIGFHIDMGEAVASVTALSAMRLLRRDLLLLTEAGMPRVRGGQIGMIFQEPMTSLNPVFTVGNQPAEALVLHRDQPWSAAVALRLTARVRISRLPDPAAGSITIGGRDIAHLNQCGLRG